MTCGQKFHDCQNVLGGGTPADMPISPSEQQRCPLLGEESRSPAGNPEYQDLLDKAATLPAVKADGAPQAELREIVETGLERMREAQSAERQLYFARQIDAIVQGLPIFRAGGYGDDVVRSPGAILRFEADELGNDAQLRAVAQRFGVEPNEVCDHIDQRFQYAQWAATCEEALTNYADAEADAVEMVQFPTDAQRIVDMPDGALWAWGNSSSGSARQPVIDGLSLLGSIRKMTVPSPFTLTALKEQFDELLFEYGHEQYEADKDFYDKAMQRIATGLLKNHPLAGDDQADPQLLFGLTQDDIDFWQTTQQKTKTAKQLAYQSMRRSS